MQLFHFHTSDIKVTVDAYFENGALVIEGYDIGKTVNEYWGDSDYEYNTWGLCLRIKRTTHVSPNA